MLVLSYLDSTYCRIAKLPGTCTFVICIMIRSSTYYPGSQQSTLTTGSVRITCSYLVISSWWRAVAGRGSCVLVPEMARRPSWRYSPTTIVSESETSADPVGFTPQLRLLSPSDPKTPPRTTRRGSITTIEVSITCGTEPLVRRSIY